MRRNHKNPARNIKGEPGKERHNFHAFSDFAIEGKREGGGRAMISLFCTKNGNAKEEEKEEERRRSKAGDTRTDERKNIPPLFHKKMAARTQNDLLK